MIQQEKDIQYDKDNQQEITNQDIQEDLHELEQPKKAKEEIQSTKQKQDKKPMTDRRIIHPKSSMHRVEPTIFRALSLIFKEQIRKFCDPKDVVLSIKPFINPQKVILYYTDENKFYQIDDKLSQLIESINYQVVDNVAGNYPPCFMVSYKIKKVLKEKKLGIIRQIQPKYLSQNKTVKQNFTVNQNITYFDYVLIGKAKKHQIQRQAKQIKEFVYRIYTLFNYPNTRSHRFILQYLFSTELFRKEYLIPNQLNDIEVLYPRKQQVQTGDIQVLMSMARRKHVHALMNISKLAPALIKVVQDFFGVFVLTYFGQKISALIQEKVQAKTQNFHFKYLQQSQRYYAQNKRNKLQNKNNKNQFIKEGQRGLNRCYVYIFFQKKHNLNSEKIKSNLIEALKLLNVDFKQARIFHKFPSIDISDLDNQKYLVIKFPRITNTKQQNHREKYTNYSSYIKAKSKRVQVYMDLEKKQITGKKKYMQKQAQLSSKNNQTEQKQLDGKNGGDDNELQKKDNLSKESSAESQKEQQQFKQESQSSQFQQSSCQQEIDDQTLKNEENRLLSQSLIDQCRRQQQKKEMLQSQLLAKNITKLGQKNDQNKQKRQGKADKQENVEKQVAKKHFRYEFIKQEFNFEQFIQKVLFKTSQV